MRVEELDTDDEDDGDDQGLLLDPFLEVQRFGREESRLIRMGNTSHGRRRGSYEYDDDVSGYSNDDDVTEGLGGDTDSLTAYAMKLASREKEDLQVDKALERIRRAQFLGKKRVYLSPQELEALLA